MQFRLVPVTAQQRGTQLAAIAALAGLAQGVSAQTDPSPDAPLKEIVITAERRVESLQSVPVAAAALNSDQLEQRGIQDFTDIQYQTPATSVQTNGLTTFFNIRGVGLNASTPSVTAGVAKLVDGAFIVGTGLALGDPFFDLERVEVLRGPQGTFVGQESTGGAVYLITKDPRLDQTSFSVAQTLGHFGLNQTEGALNLPFSDKVALRLAFKVENRDSYTTNVGSSGKEPGDLHSDAFRLKLLARPTDDLSVLLSYERYWLRSDGPAFKPTPANPSYFLDPYANSPYTVAYNAPTSNDNTIGRAIAKIDYNLTQDLLLRSLTSLQTLRVSQAEDVDATSVPLFEQNQYLSIGPNTVWTEELDLLSTGAGPLKWTVGFFFDHQTQSNVIDINNVGPFVGGPFSISIVNPAGYTQSEGVFGQVSYTLADSVELTAGLRENHDKAWTLSGTTTTPFGVRSNAGEASSQALTGKVAVDWKATPLDHIYATASKGSKAGGYNTGVPTYAQTFAPEMVYNYELGWKSTHLGGHLRTDIDAFYMDYRDFQLAVFTPQTGSQSPVINLPKSGVKGIEAQAETAFGNFSANASAAYIDSSISQNTLLIDARTLPGGGNQFLPPTFDYTPFYQNVDGRPLPYSPKWTLSAGLQYAIPVGSGTLTPRIQWAYLGSQRATLFVNPGDYIPSHATVDARIEYRPTDNLAFQVFGTNLANQAYITGITQNNAFYGEPRQYGIKVAYTTR